MMTPDIVGIKHEFGSGPDNSYTNFSESGPMGLWEESRTTQDFAGHYTPIGGSNPNLGYSTWDDYGLATGQNLLQGGGPG